MSIALSRMEMCKIIASDLCAKVVMKLKLDERKLVICDSGTKEILGASITSKFVELTDEISDLALCVLDNNRRVSEYIDFRTEQWARGLVSILRPYVDAGDVVVTFKINPTNVSKDVIATNVEMANFTMFVAMATNINTLSEQVLMKIEYTVLQRNTTTLELEQGQKLLND